jgi:hypothetical protein
MEQQQVSKTTQEKAPHSKWNPQQLFLLKQGWLNPNTTFEDLCESISAVGVPRTGQAVQWKASELRIGRRQCPHRAPAAVPANKPSDVINKSKTPVNYANHAPVTRMDETLRAAKEQQENLIREAAEVKAKEKEKETMRVEFLKYDKITQDTVLDLKSKGFEVDVLKRDGQPDEITIRQPKPIEVPKAIIIPRKETDKGQDVQDLEFAMTSAIKNFMQEYMESQMSLISLQKEANQLLKGILESENARTAEAKKFVQRQG